MSVAALQADTPLRYLKGVGPRRAEALAKEGLERVEDLLYHLPFRYEDRSRFARVSELAPESGHRTLLVRVLSGRIIPTRRRGLVLFEAWLEDDSGRIRALWYNQPYLERVMVPGRRAVVFGRVVEERFGGQAALEHPDYEILEDEDAEGIHAGRIVPVYRKLAGIGSRHLRTLIHRALESLAASGLPETVPAGIRHRQGLMGRLEALRQVHFPLPGTPQERLERRESPAHRCLAFEEIFLLQLALGARREALRRRDRGVAYQVTDAMRTRLARVLPFRLTEAQRRVLREIAADLQAPWPMNRLLQGDVGSGKTIVALLTLLVAVENGYQGALMAPTEILAEQHLRTFRQVLEGKDLGVVVRLLTGGMRARERQRVLEETAAGRVNILVGTHALFEKGVRFARLGLVVVDEQHRFGVLQRAALASKGSRPDVLVMTATPIPRSLALTVYGDLDLSVLDELPPGRTPVRTVVRGEGQRRRVYEGIRREVRRGRQVYVVVPLVEETEKSDLKAATTLARHLQTDVFPEFRVGLLHGRMRGEEKDEVMRAFAQGDIQILVSTTVVEVGVDVPNATVMVVEHAERFGLSQLHQLRGRVGRGSDRSYCVLMVGSDAPAQAAMERLRVMERTHDGFVIAEKDLELRGPGVVFGTQQHGLTDLQFLAQVLRDPELLDRARGEARRFLTEEGMERARKLLGSLRPAWKTRMELARVG